MKLGPETSEVDFKIKYVITESVQKHFELETIGFTHNAIAFKLGRRITVDADDFSNNIELPYF